MARVVVTGGAGFIGSNLTARLLREGHDVTLFDHLGRAHVHQNLAWLQGLSEAGRLQVVRADLADFPAVVAACAGTQRIYHLGGQVAVTSSLVDPRTDFLSNAYGTLNVLEAARLVGDNPIVLYSSTNKVYGDLRHLRVREEATRYAFVESDFGVSETEPLDLHTPYGCSKGAGEQYVRDYFRVYGIRTVVFRQSCIYGKRQFGSEDQGWVAWLTLASYFGKQITIFGDGKQVRDLLYVDDLLDVYGAAVAAIDQVAGEVFNVGGGPAHTVSVWREFGPLLQGLLGRSIPVQFAPWRPSDQRVFIADIRKARRLLGWEPRVSVPEGVSRLLSWIQAHPQLFEAA
ncbi:MAG: GDP-mannose 4,6-dehydratase [Chloroflexi bacterium]|nr:GDP-mannose 4,6-dehydratase [Chloroflexota bacterium]